MAVKWWSARTWGKGSQHDKTDSRMQEPRPSVVGHKANGHIAIAKPSIDRVAPNGVYEIILAAARAAYHRKRMLPTCQPLYKGQYQTRKCLPHEDGTNAAVGGCQHGAGN